MSEIRFGVVSIGDAVPVLIIAEAACEHLGSLEVAKRIIKSAHESGADVIKFQLHVPEEMLPNSIHFWGGSMDDVLARYNLDVGAQAHLMEYCNEVGIQYLCTPFSARAADLLEDIGVLAFKTGSGEMTNLPMLRHIARKDKPMIVSTGMATLEEVDATVNALKGEGAAFALTHCTSAYPPRYEEVNLRFIPILRERYGVMIGHSDHTPDIWTAVGAVAIGARIIEKHFTLDRALKGPDYHVSLEPNEFRSMVDGIRKLESALGSEKRVYPDEEVVRDWAHHSVVSLQVIPRGTLITPEMIGVKRPGRGVPARHLEAFYNLTAARNIPAHVLMSWDDVTDDMASPGA